MSDFKKLPCVAGCPTPLGAIDCNGDPINVGDAIARCEDIPDPTTVTVTNTVAGHTIATVNVNGTPTDIKETVTAITAVTFDEATRTLTITYRDEAGSLVTFDENIPAIDAVIHIGPAVITPPTLYPQYYNQIVTDGNGSVWAFAPDGTATLLNITQTVTTITDVLSYANKHEIFKYTNEANFTKVVFETVTSLTDALTSGTKIGTHVAEDGTETDIFIPLYSLVALSGMQTSGHTIGTINIDGTPTAIKETVTSVSNVLTGGDKIGTYVDEAGNSVDIYAPKDVVTTMTNVVNGHRIGTYTNEASAAVDIDETVTSLNSLTYSKATGEMTVEYTDERGLTSVSTTNILAQAPVYFNDLDPNTGTIFSFETPPLIDNPSLKGDPDYVYVGTDGVSWFWNGTSYVTAPVPIQKITTMTNTQATGKIIGTYKNEADAIVNIRETVTTLKSVSYNKPTGILTVVYTDENGADITKTTSVVSQATAFINGTNPATATIFSLTTPPTVNDNTLKNNEDYVYVGTDGSTWYWNGTAYVTAPVLPDTTEWWIAGTAIDAKGNKTGSIARTGKVTIGKNVAPIFPLDVYDVGPKIYSAVARFINPDNKVPGNNTQLVFGAASETGNSADWRFYYAGSNSGSNRIDFGFSGYAAPVMSYLVNGRVGIRTTAPNSTLHVNGSFSAPIKLTPGAVGLTEFDYTLMLSSPGTNQSLPSPAGIDGRIYNIRNNSTTGNCFVTGAISGSATVTVTLPPGGCRTFQALSGAWWIVSGFNP